MKGLIPRDPAWCSSCIEGKPCEYHRGGKAYAGDDVYEPSAWVLEVVGRRYRGWDALYECIGYDPRHGFWMQQVDAPHTRRNVSERAIDRTYHQVWLTPGAWRLAQHIRELGRLPTQAEAPDVTLAGATYTLRDLGMLDGEQLTAAGVRIAETPDFFQIQEAP